MLGKWNLISYEPIIDGTTDMYHWIKNGFTENF